MKPTHDMTDQQPFLLRLLLVMGVLCLAFLILVQLQVILIPLAFAGVLSSLFMPFIRRMERWGMRSGLAIILCMLLLVVAIAGLVLLFSAQAANFVQDYQLMRDRLLQAAQDVLTWLQKNTPLNADKEKNLVSDRLQEALGYVAGFAATTLATTGSALVLVLLIPIYTFFLLHYRQVLINSILSFFPRIERKRITGVLEQMRAVMGQYMLGMLTVMLIVATVASVGLLLIGVPHALFLGCLGAILNVIPYLGIFSVALFSATYGGLMLNSLGSALFVLVLFISIHITESNLITPVIVGRKVRINAFAALLGIFIGGEVWGLPGLILALPYVATVRVLSENIRSLAPLAILLGEKHERIKKPVTKVVESEA